MLKRLHFLPLLALGFAAIATASIERLDLRQMIARSEAGVYGEIISHDVVAVPLPDGGHEMTFTTLRVRGSDVISGKEVTVAVSYPGGVLPGDRGGYNSEAPSVDDVKVGNRVLVFYKWSDNMGGGFAANALYASHGGLFRSFTDKRGRVVVQGRGKGYAIAKNTRLDDLRKQAKAHHAAIQREQTPKKK